jgi:hypothetical protein
MTPFSKEEISSRKEQHNRCSMLLVNMSLNSGSDLPEVKAQFMASQAEYIRISGEKVTADASLHTMD